MIRNFALILAALAAIMQSHPTIAQDDDVDYRRVPVPRSLHDTSSTDVNARSEFSVAEQVANQYLVVKLEITKTSITPFESSLVRGPDKTSSAIKDLQIRALNSTGVVAQYSVADPRFLRFEPGASPRDLARSHRVRELASSDLIIYVPLSSTIDKVEIVPEPGRDDIVSSGGDFDPLPWATVACTGHDPDRYPNCPAILALGIPPP
jgi:hypothetical protein